ncbi:hypothetical protein ACWGUL_08730 [Streptomyces albidoflavus]
MIQQRNGHTGEAHGFAANLAKAKRILWPAAQEPPTPHRCRRRTPFAPTPDGTAPHQRRAPAEASPGGHRSGVGVHDLARQAPIARLR